MSFAEIAVALPVEGTFTYAIPPDVDIAVGHAVVVEFSRRKVTGYVVGLAQTSEIPRIKPIIRLLDTTPAFDSTQLAFFRWISDYYLSGLGEVIATALPSGYRGKTRRIYTPTTAGIDTVAGGTLPEEPRTQVLREVIARPGRTRSGLARVLHHEVPRDVFRKALDALIRDQLVEFADQAISGPGSQRISVHLLVPADECLDARGVRMRGVIAALAEAGGVADLSVLVEREGPGARDAVTRLERRGLVRRESREDRTPAQQAVLTDHDAPPSLNADQRAALDAILKSEQGALLLHGVTGSGKTEVYLRAAATVLERGQQVLVLVPEIALTPQLVGRFHARFGDQIAVLHSGLAPSARLREWRRIRAREAQIAVGARSALFAPFCDLGLIVVDEEHDDSYKQDDGVRYHARDLAVVRGRIAGCPVVLGSATPSAETWQNAREERYARLPLPQRATSRPVPTIELVDTRGRGGADPISPELHAALIDTFAAGGKAIVLYNRRGFAPVVQCPGCGAGYVCPSCGIGMVYHRRRGRVQCHYCGLHRPFAQDCPACGTEVEILGHGTERIEDALKVAFPAVATLRMDADTTRGRDAHQRLLSAFRHGDAQMLVGTQLVAKGHDFPDVLLAAVVGVDHILMMPDFRSAERTHALVTQLAGRAGRGEIAGRVIVQTRHADHFVFRLLTAPPTGPEGMDAFLEQETHQRRILGVPPFCRLVLVRIEGTDLDVVRNTAADLGDALRKAVPLPRGVDVFGPVLAPMSRVAGRWRYQLVLRGRDVSQFRRWLDARRPLFHARSPSKVRVNVDVDPRNLM